MDKRKIACAVWWIGSLPVRILIGVLVLPIVIIGIPCWCLLDLKEYGCEEKNKSSWDDWSFIDIPKSFYWDFVILGKVDL